MLPQTKITNIFKCEKCEYITYKRGDYNKHLLTTKHLNQTNNIVALNKQAEYICDKCSKIYKSRVGLWGHKKTCVGPIENVKSEEASNKELIMLLIKENVEMKNMIMEACNKMQPINVLNNVNYNNKFNLNFFLNETCKDALNLTDFVGSLKLQLSDLENVGSNGYVNGISNIIIKNLNALEINKRPLHCSDIKREIIYVKDENKWEKENNNIKLTKVIKKVAYKNVLQIESWKKFNPGCEYSDNKNNDEYLKIVNESMGAFTNEENEEYVNKIIKNISKEISIDKDNH